MRPPEILYALWGSLTTSSIAASTAIVTISIIRPSSCGYDNTRGLLDCRLPLLVVVAGKRSEELAGEDAVVKRDRLAALGIVAESGVEESALLAGRGLVGFDMVDGTAEAEICRAGGVDG